MVHPWLSYYWSLSFPGEGRLRKGLRFGLITFMNCYSKKIFNQRKHLSFTQIFTSKLYVKITIQLLLFKHYMQSDNLKEITNKGKIIQ